MKLPKIGRKTVISIVKWGSLVVIIALAFIVSFAARSGRVKTYSMSPVPVRVAKPVYGDFVRSIDINGHVESNTMVTVLPLVSGILKEVNVDLGQYVSKGQVVAEIDAERFSLQLQQAKAAWLNAKSTYERVSQLFAAQATSLQNYEQAKAQYDAYSSQYDLAKLQLEYTLVKSPMNGVVLAKHLSAGSLAAPERPLVTIGDIKDLIVRLRVPEKYYEIFTNTGKRPKITVTRNGVDMYEGIIRNVSPYISADTKNFEATIAVIDKASELRPGMFVTVTIELERVPSVFMLPVSSLSGSRQVWYIADNKARSETVDLEYYSDTLFVVPDAWKDRNFVIEGADFLKEGSPVVLP